MGQEAHDRAQQAGFNHHFDPAKPWAWVSVEQCMEVLGFWHREVTEPCMLYLAKTTNLNALVEDDCLTRPREIITTSTRSMPAQTSQPSQPSRPTKRARGPDIREHRVGEDGSFTHTRQGIELCRLFQTGECTEKDSRHNCARNSKCLAETHGANKCQSDGPKQPRANHGRKGRGKGSK